MVTGEYGEKNKRPHWHVILFNYRPKDATYKYTNTTKNTITNRDNLTAEELAEHKAADLLSEIEELEKQINEMKPNLNAIKDYREKNKALKEKQKEFETKTAQRDAIRTDWEQLKKKRFDDFMEGFSEIKLKLKQMYQMITMGGDADLELVDTCDPFEGIVFSVRPPKKSWKNISNLSGGEKTLSSLALVFALHHYKPSPLYVMDEIDAALDFKNVSIVANYIKERTKNAQFIIISLRNYMFELANFLTGIYKTQNVSHSVTIDPRKFSIPLPVAEQPHPAKNTLLLLNADTDGPAV